MPYTIRLVALECFAAQEVDGDDIYIKLNNSIIWRCEPDRMNAPGEYPHRVSQYDFAGGRKLTTEGWMPMMPFNPDAFVHGGLTDKTMLQVWDSDTLTSDDMIGQTPIDASQASGGNISVIFRRDGAHYRLTYKVSVE